MEELFVQILKIYKFHCIVATNFNFCAIDNTDKTTVHNVYHGTIIQTIFCIIVPFVYIFDAFLNASFRKKADELKYPIYFIQDI